MVKKYTLLFIPPDHMPARQFQFSTKSKRVLIIGTILIGGMLTGLFAHELFQAQYIRKHEADYARVDQLEAMLQEKQNEINHLNEQSAKMTESISNISSLEGKISSILKLQPPGASSRPNDLKATPQSYTPSRSADINADIVASHLDLFQQYYNEAVKYETELNHTPSFLPVQGNIASSFGYRKNPFGGWSKEFHNGIDIACEYGTPVHVTADGIVTFAGWDGVYGRKVEIDHGNGIITFYGHNSGFAVKAGDKVKKGDVIAYSGNSGRSTGAHLHYGALINGKSVDPLIFTNSIKEQ